MNNSSRDSRSPLGLFPGRPAPRLYDRMVPVSGETRRIRRGHRWAYRGLQIIVRWIFCSGAVPSAERRR
jgi:hypothetical protein